MNATVEQKLDMKPLRIPKIRPLEKMGLHPTRLGQPAEQYDYTSKPDRQREIVEFFNYHDFAVVRNARKSFDKLNQSDLNLDKLVKDLQSSDQKVRLDSALVLLYISLGKFQLVDEF